VKAVVVAVSALALAGCSAQNEPPAAETQADAGPVDPMDTTNRAELSDREVSDRFIEVFYNQNRLTDGFRAWVHPEYIQHDPNSPTGRDATIAVLAAHMEANPEMTHDVKRVIYGDDGMVAVHYHFKRDPADRGMAVVDIYHVKDGYLVEHWDVLQPVPDPAEVLNENTMF